MKSSALLMFLFINVLFGTYLEFWTALSPAITILIVAVAGWITMKTRKDVADVKVDLTKTKEHVEKLEVHTNSLTEKLVQSTEKAAVSRTLVEERERVDAKVAEVALVEAKVAEGVRTALAENPAAPVASDVAKNVIETGKDVKVVKHDVGEIKTEVIKDVKAGVAEAVKDAKEKPK